MTKKAPLFTIITPIFNRGHLIQATIKSVLGQDFIDFEYILIDDGSSDNSVEIINQYMTEDPRISLIAFNENQGRCAARNQGLQNAKGDWICYLDSDDVYYPNHLEVLAEMIETNPDNKVFATSQHINGSRKEDRIKKSSNSVVELGLNDFIEKNPLTANQICVHHSISTKWSNERIPISEDLLYFRELVLESIIIKSPVVTNNLIDHQDRTMNSASADNFSKYNLQTAESFIDRQEISHRLKNRILSHTLILCANVFLSANEKKSAIPLIKRALKLPRTYINPYFYISLLKLFLK